MERVTVAWCRSCQHYTPADEIGEVCPAECTWKLTRRVGYICPRCEVLHRTQRQVKACECGGVV